MLHNEDNRVRKLCHTYSGGLRHINIQSGDTQSLKSRIKILVHYKIKKRRY